MTRPAAKLSIALALALAAVNGAPASAHPDGAGSGGAHAGDALQNARQSMPKYGGRAGSSYGPHDYRLGARFDYGFDGSKASKAAEGAMENAADHTQDNDCPPYLGHGIAPGATGDGGELGDGDPPPKYLPGKNGASGKASSTDGKPKPPANKDTPPKEPAKSGEKMTEVPEPPAILTGENGRRDRFDVFPDPKGVDYETAGSKGGFSEVGGLELENDPIEYRDGSSGEYNKTKQPGLPKYTNINGPRPPVDGKLAEEFLREIKFRIDVEKLEAEHFPERQRKSAQHRSSRER